METRTEILFAEICDDLRSEKFSPSEIAIAINGELSSPALKIRYCNEVEVKEALGALGHTE